MTPFRSASSWRASARFKTDDGVSGFRSPNVTQFGPRWRGDTPSPAPSATPWHPWARTPRRGRARPRPRAPPTRPTARARGRPCLISSAGARWLGTRTPGTSPRARPRARDTAGWPSRPSRIPRSSKPPRRGARSPCITTATTAPRRRSGCTCGARAAARATSWDAPAMAEPKPAAASSAPGDPGVGPDAVSAAAETPPPPAWATFQVPLLAAAEAASASRATRPSASSCTAATSSAPRWRT